MKAGVCAISIRGRFLAARRRTRTFVDGGYNPALMAGQRIKGRWLAPAAAILLVACAGAGMTAAPASAQQPRAHAASRTATLILRASTSGKYEVVVMLRARGKHSREVHVYLTGQKAKKVRAYPWWSAKITYTLKLTASALTVRTVNPAPAVQVKAKLIRKSASAGTTSSPTTSVQPTTPAPAPAPAPAPTPAPPANPPFSTTYTQLVWDDEFQGTAGSPADSNWTYDTGPSCGDAGCSTDTTSTANAALVGGTGGLAINALSCGSGCYTSAQLETAAVFHVGEELDARIKLPAGQGLWGGFWFYEGPDASGNICNPAACGELDVLEAPEFGPSPTDDFFDLHGPINGQEEQQWEAVDQSLGDLSQGFHTYGVIWNPGQIIWTVDGNAVASATPASLDAGSTWEFDQGDYHMLLDLAVGGWPGNPTSATVFPATMLVDWVRVYAAP